MKAVICPKYGPPEVLQFVEMEKPDPGPDELLIKIKASSVTVADMRVRSFTIPAGFWIPARLMLGITKPKKPVLGIELSGEIEAVGNNVNLFKVGDQVFAACLRDFGGYAEYICLNQNGPIALKPDNLSLEESATIPIGGRTALHYLKKVNISPGKKVLIYGASGSVGTYAVQLAKHYGSEVTGICSGKNSELIKSLGADKVIDYTDGDFTSQLEKYDVIFIAVDKWPFSSCKDFLKEDGCYVNVTAPFKSFDMIWTSMTTKKKIMVGENSLETADDLNLLKQLIEKGVMKPVIDRSYSIDQIVEAHRYGDMGHKIGNIIIEVS